MTKPTISHATCSRSFAAHHFGSAGSTPTTISRRPGITASTDIDELNECDIVVAPAAKCAFVRSDHRWDLGIIDEAYQVSSVDLAKFSDKFTALLPVGDPGQLNPFTTADERAIRSTGSWPLETAAGTVLGTYPDTPVVPLPVSWRLPPSGARIVADAFYSRPFTAGADETERGLRLPLAAIRDSVDETLRVAQSFGWCLARLPDAHLPPTIRRPSRRSRPSHNGCSLAGPASRTARTSGPFTPGTWPSVSPIETNEHLSERPPTPSANPSTFRLGRSWSTTPISCKAGSSKS
jgi:hypothetical protein